MASPAEFEREMIQFGLTAKRNAVVAVRTAFERISRRIITETPADVGTAVSNWLPSTEVPAVGTRPAYAPGAKGSTKGENAAATVEAVLAVAATYLEPEQSLHLTNNLPYIEKLNGGSSTQAPALFVDTAIAEGMAVAKYTRLLD